MDHWVARWGRGTGWVGSVTVAAGSSLGRPRTFTVHLGVLPPLRAAGSEEPDEVDGESPYEAPRAPRRTAAAVGVPLPR